MPEPIIEVRLTPSENKLRLEWGLTIKDHKWVWDQPKLEVRLYCRPYPDFGKPTLLNTDLEELHTIYSSSGTFTIPFLDVTEGKDKSRAGFRPGMVAADPTGKYYPLEIDLSDAEIPAGGVVCYPAVEWRVDGAWLEEPFDCWVVFGYTTRNEFIPVHQEPPLEHRPGGRKPEHSLPDDIPTVAADKRVEWRGTSRRLFVSYSHDDMFAVNAIVQRLNQEFHYDIWIDYDSIRGGTQWREEIARGVAGADRVLFMFSPTAVNSDWCEEEVRYALARGIPVIPIRINGACSEGDLDRVGLGGVHYRDFAKNPPEWDWLLADLPRVEGTDAPTCETFAWQSGAAFDKYILCELLGTGGNGQVWLADEHLPDGPARQVAIKVLRESVSLNPTRALRFKREIGTMARIDHPSIVRVYTYGECGGQLYVVMPYLKGGTLRSRLTGKPLPHERAMRLLEQIGAALDHVHDRYSGLIHRDVKPENMLFAEDGETLYLADFGLVFSTDGEERLTDEGKPAGTGRYMAPEQWRNQPLSRQTDLYALGILAYELLTGHLPFLEKNDLDLGRAHTEHELPSDINLPDEVLRILRKATAKAPGERYPTARAVLTDLRNWHVDPANLEPRIRDYLQWVTDELYEGVRAQFVELAGDETAQRMLPVRPKVPTWDDTDDLFARASANIHADHITPEDETHKTFVENVRERLQTVDRAVLVGEPGSGKTWMLRRLQADYARAWLKQSREGTFQILEKFPIQRRVRLKRLLWLLMPEMHPSGEGRKLIPVLVRLNEYTGGMFEDFVKKALDTLAPYHDQLRREGRLILLCDALNEMPRGARQMAELVAYLKNTPYFIVSCRIRDYRDDLGELKPLEQVLLRDLELDAIHDLIHKRLPERLGAALWRQIGGTDALFKFWREVREKGESERFWDVKQGIPSYTSIDGNRAWRTMHQGARLILLARSPYMGDLLCRTYQESGSLPASHAALFKQFVDQMLNREARTAHRRGEVFPEKEDIEAALVALARTLQAAKRTVIAHKDAPQAIGRADADALLKAATDAGILGVEGDSLKFTHQLLQEYFAVQILLQAMEAGQSPAEFFGQEWWNAGVWREAMAILGKLLGEGGRGANIVARWLAPVSPEVALEVITRSGASLTLNDVEEMTRDLLVRCARNKTSEPDPVGCAAAYRVLGWFRVDTRKGIGTVEYNGVRLPGFAWCEVPAGTFQMGSDPGAYNAWDGAEYDLPYTFWIAKYPVTYAQYEPFVAAGGYTEKYHRCWTEAGWQDKGERTEPYLWNDPKWHISNHPVVGLTWYEAYAYTQWLNALIPRPLLPQGEGKQASYVIQLARECEWEKAARYPDRRFFPWGDEWEERRHVNWNGSSIGRTSAVGMFPGGTNPTHGACDLSGNVWEWCITEWETSYSSPAGENNDPQGNTHRVLRGGSWRANYPASLRAAYCYGYSPAYQDLDIGFRVVYVPSFRLS